MAAALLAGAAAAWITAPSEVVPAPHAAGSPTSTSALQPGTDQPATGQPALDQPATDQPGTRALGSARTTPSGQPRIEPTARDARPGATRSDPLAAPTRFEVAGLDITMQVRPVGVAPDGQMGLPSSPAVMGWYEHGPRPGDAAGAAVLAAHRDMPGYGTGPAAGLEQVRRREVLTVRSGSAVRRYRVTEVTRLEKESLDLEGIFSRDGPPRLHVVTCSGRFDPGTRAYEENLVVVGILVE